MSDYTRKNPLTDPTATPRWCDCEFCGQEFLDTSTFLTELYHWLQSICDECKRKCQAEVRYEVAVGTPQLAHLIDERDIVLSSRVQGSEISIDQPPRPSNRKEEWLRVTLSTEGGGKMSVNLEPAEVADIVAVLTGWLTTGKLTQPVLPKKEQQ